MKLFKILAALTLILIAVISCKKEETSAGASERVAGSFIGRVQYQGNSLEVDRYNRLIRIQADGDSTYKIEFFTGVPDITRVKFKPTDDSTWTSTDTAQLKTVIITGNMLKIDYLSNGERWTVDKAIRQ